MKAELVRQVLEFEGKLKIGSQVRVKWITGHAKYQSIGMVSKVERLRFKVKLLREVQFRDSTARFAVGYEVQVPRFRYNQLMWDRFNCVEPYPKGYSTEEVKHANRE